jgi:DNA-binding beta-propeller fold protein YncE
MTRFCAVCLLLGALLGPSCRAQELPQQLVDQGIRAQFRVQPAVHPGEPVSFRFDLADTASGAPMRGLRPAAWLSASKPEGRPSKCAAKAAAYLSGDLFTRADIDLNSYYVLTLNDDATISVVDPVFGFGGSKLLNLLQLEARGADWALASEQSSLFVSMPAAGKVALIDTRQWRVVKSIATGPNPRRIVTAGSRAWVADDAGASAIDINTLALTSLAFGASTDLAKSSDDDWLFAGSGNHLVVVDARAARIAKRVPVDGTPTLLAYSSGARAVYALDAHQGRLFAMNAEGRLLATVAVRPGATQIRFAPDGRHALIANPQEDVVQVLDAASNRIVQTMHVGDGPDRISFSDRLAYVQRRGSEIVQMIPLEQIGHEGQDVGIAEFPAGQHGLTSNDGAPNLADALVNAPEGSAMLVANSSDKMVYLYNEGMAAPAGGFNTYGQKPQAVLVVDHGLREVREGQYATSVEVKRGGLYDVVLFVDSPRVVACFSANLATAVGSAATAQHPAVHVAAVDPPRELAVGRPAHLRFALRDGDGHALPGVSDIQARAFEAPGIWQWRSDVVTLPNGQYEFEFVPPQAGIYYVWLESASLGLVHSSTEFETYLAN